MYDMINGLLAYSRIQTGDRELKEVDMNYIIEQVKKPGAQINKRKAIVSNESLPVILTTRADGPTYPESGI
jgi:light-regulated signal transduction histidine kinase (bacteriophytochrome)